MCSDAKLILQKKQGGRATTSLVSLSYKSPASAVALRGTGVTHATLPDYSLNSLKWPAIHAAIMSELWRSAKIFYIHPVLLWVTVNTPRINVQALSAA